MSAYVVASETVDLLVTAAVKYGLTDERLADEAGQLLAAECVQSVSYRYPDDDVQAGELPGPIDPWYLRPYRWTQVEADTQAVINAAREYAYQSCEHPGWEPSVANALVSAIRAHAEQLAEAAQAIERAVRMPVRSIPCAVSDGDRDFTDVLCAADEHGTPSFDRAEAIKAIRNALKRRSGRSWSVRGGRGTGWGWISVSAPPRRCGDWGQMTDEDAAELGELLGLNRSAHQQGESIPASTGHYREYIARAEGRTPDTYGEQYWD